MELKGQLELNQSTCQTLLFSQKKVVNCEMQIILKQWLLFDLKN